MNKRISPDIYHSLDLARKQAWVTFMSFPALISISFGVPFGYNNVKFPVSSQGYLSLILDLRNTTGLRPTLSSINIIHTGLKGQPFQHLRKGSLLIWNTKSLTGFYQSLRMEYITVVYVDRVNLGDWISLGKLLKKEIFLSDLDILTFSVTACPNSSSLPQQVLFSAVSLSKRTSMALASQLVGIESCWCSLCALVSAVTLLSAMDSSQKVGCGGGYALVLCDLETAWMGDP